MSTIIQSNQVFNNEVPFCRVYSMESKRQLEERFLAHRISYFIEWQDKSIFQRIFDRKGSKIVCTFRINKGDILKAKELCQGIDGIKFKDLGDIQLTERIRRRSEAARPVDLGMEVPSTLRYENSLTAGSLNMESSTQETEQEQYDTQYTRQGNEAYEEQYTRQGNEGYDGQYSDQYNRQYAQQYDQYGQYEGYEEEDYEGGYEEGYYEEGYEEGYEDQGYDTRGYGNQGYTNQSYGSQGYEGEYEDEYYEEGYDDGYGNYGNYGNYDNYNG